MANGSRQAVWEFFGAELKRRRENAELTQVELGARVFVSGGYIGQFEQAIRKPQLDVAQRIDEVLQTDGIFERLCRKLIDDPRYADYFAHVVELERLASRICEFAPTVVKPPQALNVPCIVKRYGLPFSSTSSLRMGVPLRESSHSSSAGCTEIRTRP